MQPEMDARGPNMTRAANMEHSPAASCSTVSYDNFPLPKTAVEESNHKFINRKKRHIEVKNVET